MAELAAFPLRHVSLLRALARSPGALIGLVILGAWIVVAIGAPWLALHDLGTVEPAASHWLGTDATGQDLWSCIAWGARTTLVVVALPTGAAFLAGSAIGLAAGYRGGWADTLGCRFGDTLLSFPALLLYVVLFAAFGPSLLAIVVAVTLATAPGIARVARGEVLAQRSRDYVRAAEARGEPALWILLGEILPNAMGPLLGALAVRAGQTAILTGTLGFLRLGPPPSLPDWGRMVAGGAEKLGTHWPMAVLPGLALASVVLACNLIGDALRRRDR